MKTRCDSCHNKAASIYCYVEEVALCSHCDPIHHENPLAPDHHRISFFYPVPRTISMCDICQETKAFIFCQEHKAILCRLCDIKLHTDGKFMRKHNRFLLSDAKLCTTGETSGGVDKSSPPTVTSGGPVNQVTDECGSSTSSNPVHHMEMPEKTYEQSLVDMSSDDPYGLCKKGVGDGPGFQDTDLGSFLSSLSPKRL